MHNTNIRTVLRLAAALLLCSIAPAQTPARFDGQWSPSSLARERKHRGYTWTFPSVVQNSSFRGEHGVAEEPGYLLIEGKIADTGSARLSATGIVASRKYARGVFAHKGEEYSYDIKAQFSDTGGIGTRSAGLGYRRPRLHV